MFFDRFKTRDFVVMGGLTVLAVSLQLLALSAPFFWDDAFLFRGNPTLSGGIGDAVAGALFGNRFAGDYYRPLPQVLWWLVGNLSGWEPSALRGLNLLVASLLPAGLFLLSRRFFSTVVSTGVATLFLVFPTNVEAYAWISALPDLLVAAAVLLYAHALLNDVERSRSWPSLTVLAALAMGLLSKESGVAMVVLGLAIDPRLREHGRMRALGYHAPLFGLAVVYVVARQLIVASSPALAGDAWLPLQTLGLYLLKLVYPYPLSVLVGTPPWPAAVGLLGIAVLVLIVIALIAGRGVLRLSAGLFLATLLPYLNLVIPFGEGAIVAERYMLTAAAALCLLAGALLTQASGRAVPIAWGLLAVVGLGHATATVQRLVEWKSPGALFAGALRHYPEFVGPRVFLAQFALEENKPHEAIEHVEVVLKNLSRYRGGEEGVFRLALRAYSEAGHYDEALKYARLTFNASPDAARLMRGLHVHDHRLDYDSLVKGAVNAVGAFPDDKAVVDYAARILVFGNLQNRSDVLDKMLNASPRVEEAVRRYGEAREKLAARDPFELSVDLAGRGLLSLAFPLIRESLDALTAEQCVAAAEIAMRERLWGEVGPLLLAAEARGAGRERLAEMWHAVVAAAPPSLLCPGVNGDAMKTAPVASEALGGECLP